MAWNVVIVGGGFAGASAARELERVMPSQSARLTLVNDVNFLLYTPFLPEAAAGTLEPRHVVTPLRDILRRTYLRLGAVCAHDPAARAVTLRTHEGEREELRYDQLLVAVGSVSRSLPIPGLDQHAIGFKSLADAIWLRNHVIETLEAANATEDPARRDRLLTYVFVGGGYSGLEALAELQDFAADAIERYPRARLHGMRWILVEASDRVLPEIDLDLADYALRELRGRGIDVRLGTRLERRERGLGPAVDRRGRSRPRPSSGRPASPRIRASRRSALPLDERGRVEVDEYLRVRGLERRLGGRRLRRGPRSRQGPRDAPVRRPRSTRFARARWRRTTSPPRSARPSVGGGSTTSPRRPSSTSVATRRSASSGALAFRGFPAWWMARTYHMSQIPGLARKVRAVADWTVGLPFRRDVAEVGSIGHPRPLRDEAYARGGTHRPLE